MKSKPTTFEQQRDSLMRGGMSEVEATKLIIGATRTGALTPALLEKEFNDFGVIQQAKYKNRGINTSKEYAAWRLAGNEPLESGVGGAVQLRKLFVNSLTYNKVIRHGLTAFNCPMVL
jgi:hypothetical protein